MEMNTEGKPFETGGAESGPDHEFDAHEPEALRRELASLRVQLGTAVAALDLRNVALDGLSTQLMIWLRSSDSRTRRN